MSKKTGKTEGKTPLKENYRKNVEKGYQPIRGELDSSKPPQGGSGVPPKTSRDSKNNTE